MCGICGFITRKNVCEEALKAMNDTMYHRGPDDCGVEVIRLNDESLLGIAHRRLSIIDLSQLGHQPMWSNDGKVVIAFNGEIYNYKEIKRELSQYNFKSDSDTEVIIAAYQMWGIECVKRFNGMFAIALYDFRNETLFLARDRIGKKPLYYTQYDNDLIFGSELKALMGFPGFRKNVDEKIMARYLAQGYICAPNTMFKDVYQLQPGEVLEYKKAEIRIYKYWDIADRYNTLSKNKIKNYSQAKAMLKDTLVEAVRRRMISDVPLGTFLSGGFDSSLITAIAQSISGEPVRTFSIGFEEQKYDESGYALEVSKHLGTQHTNAIMSSKDMLTLVKNIPKYFDEPFADSSQLPTMLVSQLAKKDVTVVLSGDGGDEFFCGYNAYTDINKVQILDGIGTVLYGLSRIPGLNQMDVLSKTPRAVQTIARNRNKDAKTQYELWKTGDLINAMLINGRESYDSITYNFERRYKEKSWIIRRMLLDQDTYLPGDILTKVDRASMKYSLESRCPILDVDVMEMSYRIPQKFKYHCGEKKYILKDIAYDYIPRELLDRPKKGFGAPIDRWLRNELKDSLIESVDTDFLEKQGLFDKYGTSKLIHNFINKTYGGPTNNERLASLVWNYYMFQMWYKEYILG